MKSYVVPDGSYSDVGSNPIWDANYCKKAYMNDEFKRLMTNYVIGCIDIQDDHGGITTMLLLLKSGQQNL